MIGDVGWNTAEDLEVADGPGRNFGWPLYEGYNQNGAYWNVRPAGMDAIDCVKPRSSWRVGSFALKPGGEVERFGLVGGTVPGPDFNGSCSVGGVWYSGSDFPAEWRDVYFHGDYAGQWIRAFTMDANHFVTGQRPFLTGEAVICVATHPETGGLYYVSWGGSVKRIRYAPPGNRPPTAMATVSHTSGASPLVVNFSSAGSRDQEGTGLIYSWDFGDGTTSVERHPRKTYTAADARAFTATLTVSDSGGATARASVVVTINNTAPTATITSPAPGATIPISGPAVTMPLTAAVTSPHPESALDYRWKVFLHHNTHFHAEPEQTTAAASAVLTPLVPSPTDSFYYRIALTVTDPLGALTTVERVILPASSVAGAPPFAALGAPPTVVGGSFYLPVSFNEPVTGLTASDFTLTNGTATALSGGGATYSLSVTPAASGPVTVSLPPGTCVDAENLPNGASLAVSTFFLVAPAQPTPVPSTGDPGLKGEYYSGENFGSPALTRIDPQLDFYWPGTTSPGPGVPGDYFSARWIGRLTVPTSGSWQFIADVDDGMRLWVNDQLILDQWDQPPAFYWGLASNPLALTAGIAYDFKIEYQDFFSDSYLNLRWAGPNTAPEVVPAAAFSRPSSGPAMAPPSVRLTAPATVIAPFTVAAAFTEPVTGLTVGDFEVTNGSAGNLSGSGANYSVTITPTATGAVRIYLPPAAAVGTAATPSLDSNQLEVSYTRPQSTTEPGLRGDYFAGENFGTLKLTRVDPRLEFNWPGTTSPGPGVPGDYFSARWTGRLTVPTSGSWQFFADVDDGMRLWVNGQLILDQWNPRPSIYWGLASSPVTLNGGVAYDFKVEYQDFFAGSLLKLRWSGPNTATEVVPAAAFSQPLGGPVITPAGLKGEYYAGQDFGTLKLTRIDPRLDFNWPGTTSPGPGVPGDYFSARWTGRLTVPTSGSWQFFADVDDGMRLWVNGQLILDKWNPPPAIHWGLASSPVTLNGGVAYDFKVDYQDFFAGSLLKLRWTGPGTQTQAVPVTAFSQPSDSGTSQDGTDGTDKAAADAAAQADLPRLERSLAMVPQADGTFELQFTRQPGLRRATVLQASDTMVHWHDIFDPGWPVTQMPDGTELVRVPRACRLLVGQDGITGYFRVRSGR
ncbi:MAG: PA14 domain-containing protein, partial [Verrucomicrobiales bacterium]